MDDTATESGNMQRQDLLDRIGRKLYEAREARGDGIDAPARILKLSKNNLQALESGNWQQLPDEVYALGFLRQYSKYLQVDISHELELLKNDQYKLTKPLTFPDPAVAPSRKWAWVAGIAFILLFILFNILNSSKADFDIAEDIPLYPEQREQPATDHLPNVGQDESAGNVAMLPEGEKTETPAIIVNLVASKGSESTAAGKAPVQPVAVHIYRFEAVNGDVWLQVYAPDETGLKKGSLRKEVLLKQGHHTSIEVASESVWITCGNAPALRISVDGNVTAETGTLGAGKKVLRDYHFNIR